MKAVLRFDPDDNLHPKLVDDLGVVFRKGDVLVVDGRFYPVRDWQYDLGKNVATYWLEPGYDEHPRYPDSESEPNERDIELE
jgi:hypothetical protein